MTGALVSAQDQAERILERQACGRGRCECMASIRRGHGLTHCAGHNDPGPSMNISVKDGRVLVNCQAGCSQDQVLDGLRGRELWPDRQNGTANRNGTSTRNERLEAVWRETIVDDGTIATYLQSRGLSGAVPAKLHLCRLLPYYNGQRRPESHHPAVVAPVQRLDGQVVNLHRTYLAERGQGKAAVPKPKKLMSAIEDGATRGAAIRLAEPTDTLALAEGIETALAVLEATGTPSWATVSAGGLEAVDVPASVKRIEIFADNDANCAGQRAADAAARRLLSKGHEVVVLLPPQVDTDWLDVLRSSGPEALRNAQAIDLSVLTVTPLESWPKPDPIFGPPSAPSLSLELLPGEIADVAQDVAERQQAPVDFVVWPLLVSAAGLIGRGAGIRPKAFDDWTERPALWVAQIGPPSSLKTPAQEEGTRGLRRQQERDHESYVRALADWKADCARAKQVDPKHPDLPPAPVERRCWTADVTVEKLAILLTAEVSRGLTVPRDELAGLILDLDKYHQKGGDRQFYLQAYTGGPYTVDRVQRESLFIPDLLVNIVGGIQPDVARAIFGGGPDDGFAARFLSIWPEADPTWHHVDRWPNRTARHAMDAVNDRLAATDWQVELARDEFKPTPYCRLAAEGQQLFDQWHEGIMTSLRAGQYQGRLEGRVGKYPGLAARLILIYHLIEWVAGRSPQAGIVAAETVAAVLELVDEYVLPMEQRVYSAYAVPPDAEGARRIARWLQTANPRPVQFTAREILRRDWTGLQDAAAVGAALDWLVTRQWLREAEPEKRAGRPSNVYLVNPRLEADRG